MTPIDYFYKGLPLAVGTFALTLGVIAIKYSAKRLLSRLLALICLGGVLWLYPAFIMYIFPKQPLVVIWSSKVVYIGVTFIVVFYAHFTSKFLGLKNRLFLIIVYSLGIIFILMSVFTNNIIDGFYIYFWGAYPKAGSLFSFYWFYALSCFAYCLVRLYQASYGVLTSTYSSTERNRIKHVFWAYLLGNFGAFDFIPSYGFESYPFGCFNIAIFISVLAYAIIRHQLLDIEVIIKKTLVFAGLFAAVYIVFASFALIGQVFFERFITANRWISTIPSVIVVTFIFRPLEKLLITASDRFLFQKKYDYKELLRTFTTEVLTVLDTAELASLTVKKLCDIIKLASCAMLLKDEAQGECKVVSSQGLATGSIALAKESELCEVLEKTHSYVMAAGDTVSPALQEEMRVLGAELIIPLILHTKLIGVLSLGKKKSDEPYTQDDLDILLPLSRPLAIAISNAKLFDELSKTQAEAAQREKMAVLGTLAAGMAHEIRNPITTIKIFSEFLKEKKDDPSFIEKFERLVPKEVEKINHMITHLLEFSRPADSAAMEEVDLHEALKDTLEVLGHEMVLHDIVLKEEISALPPVWGNRKHLEEVLFNLLQNAIHAIGRRGTITVTAKERAGSVELAIRDTGCGIPQNVLPHIFEPFFTTKIDTKGVGLGLYVVKQLMVRMDGSVSVESEAGKGTTFRLVFVTAT